MAVEQRTPYQILMNLKARSCVQDLKLQKMVTELDMSKHTKSFPSLNMFDSKKTVNLFPAFGLRREKTIADISYSKYTGKEKENLVRKLELAKTEKARKSMFAVSGSKINKDNNEEKRPPKVWSLTVSRTLPSIHQCLTPLPPKSSIKRISIKKELQERPVTKQTKVVQVPMTPLNSQRTPRKVRDTPHTAATQTMQEDADETDVEQDKAEDRVEVTLPKIPSNRIDKTTMTGEDNTPISAGFINQESPRKELNESHELFSCSTRDLCSRGGRRPYTQPKMFPNLGRLKGKDQVARTRTAGSDVLPRIMASRERSRSVKTKSRSQPAPFKMPHTAFTNISTSSIK